MSLIGFRRSFTRGCSVFRRMSTDHVIVQREAVGPQQWNVATVCLSRPPVNSLNIPFTLQLTKTLKEIEESKMVDAIIIKSLLPNAA